jgi:hypothetical protein
LAIQPVWSRMPNPGGILYLDGVRGVPSQS